MIQEIITYMIIGSAITLAILKITKKLKGKRRKQNIDFQKKTISMQQHDCSSCSADCMLRDTAGPVIQSNNKLCNRIDVKSDQL